MLKNWSKIIYAVSLVSFVFGTSVLVALADEEVVPEDVISVSANNTFIADVSTISDTVSSNNSVLSEVADTVSSNNTVLLDLYNTTSGNNSALVNIEQQLGVMLLANAPTFYAYQLTDYYKDYFRGIMLNKPYSNYLAFALPKTHWSGSYNYSITHYYLIYDIARDSQSGAPLLGNYPCYDCYTENGTYKQDTYTYNLNSLPASGFGSFDDYSALIDRQFNFPLFWTIVSAGIILIIFLRRK